MNVEDVMALPAKRRPARLDAAQYVLVRERLFDAQAGVEVGHGLEDEQADGGGGKDD